MRNWRTILLFAVAMALGALSMLAFVNGRKPKQEAETLVSRSSRDIAEAKRNAIPAKGPRKVRRAEVAVQAVKQKPTMDIGDDEEARLTEEQRQLLAEIRAALDADNRKTMIRLVTKMQMSDEWPDGIPVAIRKAAIAALGWFGHDAAPEIAGFLQDGNEEVLESAIDAFESALFEADGDEEIAQILIAAAKTVQDVEAMDSFLMSLNDMRPSRAVETVKVIWESGTDAAKQALPEAVEFYTGQEGITTPEQLDQWYNDPSGENCDEPDAEAVYGKQPVN